MGAKVILFGTMGKSYKFFKNLEGYYPKNTKFYYLVSNKLYFENSRIQLNEDQCLKEWKIQNSFESFSFDRDLLKNYESKYLGTETYMKVLINDRRIFFKDYYKYTTNFKVRFNEIEFRKLLLIYFIKIEKFILKNKPNELIMLAPTTLIEHIAYLVSKNLKIKIKIVRHTKILNYQTIVTNLNEEYHSIKSLINSKKIKNDSLTKAKEYLEKFKKTNQVKYEGNLIATDNYFKITPIIKGMAKDFFLAFKVKDFHSSGFFFLKEFYNTIYRSIFSSFSKFIFKRKIVGIDKLDQNDYIFFPLHAEPEIALTLFGNDYLNQTDLINKIALNLPSSYNLIVKEHPRNIGRRSINFYRELLKMPNVFLINKAVKKNEILKKCKLVITISGFITFESVLFKKPVITFGKSIYNLLPNEMVFKYKNDVPFKDQLNSILGKYKFDEKKLFIFLASIIQNSRPVNLYNNLLTKKEREFFEIGEEQNDLKQLFKLLE